MPQPGKNFSDADGTGTRMLKKEKKEKKMETRFYTV